MECYDVALAATLENHFQAMPQAAKLVSLKTVQTIPRHIRLRNNFARLFMPYL